MRTQAASLAHHSGLPGSSRMTSLHNAAAAGSCSSASSWRAARIFGVLRAAMAGGRAQWRAHAQCSRAQPVVARAGRGTESKASIYPCVRYRSTGGRKGDAGGWQYRQPALTSCCACRWGHPPSPHPHSLTPPPRPPPLLPPALRPRLPRVHQAARQAAGLDVVLLAGRCLCWALALLCLHKYTPQ